jgi:hypothetical protein
MDRQDKRFIFCVTTGRSGTRYLAKMLAHSGAVDSCHEPRPAFVDLMRDVQLEPAVAREFLIQEKIPHIYARYPNRHIYIETSHHFCKGFFEAWLSVPDLPLPDLIILDRNLRQVALSMHRLHSIPGRTASGLRHYLSPNDTSNYTGLRNWSEMNDYQLCYWYCLEIEERKKIYADFVRQKGGLVVETSLDELRKLRGFITLRKKLRLPKLSVGEFAKYFFLRSFRQNKKNYAKKKLLKYTEYELQQFDEEVRKNTFRKDKSVEDYLHL